MKSLLLPLVASMLLASCQPSDNSNTGTSMETLTHAHEKQPGAVKAGIEKDQPLILGSNKNASASKAGKYSKSKLFQAFLKGFPQASLPLTLNSKTSKVLKDKQYISYAFESFIPEMAGELFSREVGKEFYPLACINETDKFTTVVYAIKNVMMGDNAPYGYVLASYSNKGKLIDKMIAGGKIEMEDALLAGNIRPDMTIDIKEYKQHWAKNPKKKGYYDNKVTATTLTATRNYRITDNGHFEEDNQLPTASLVLSAR